MTRKRAGIKQVLAIKQTYAGVVRCALCGLNENAMRENAPGSDLHELFLEKDDVQGAPQEVYTAIHETELNLMILCNRCNMVHAKSKLWRTFLFRKQLDRIGSEAGAETHQAALDLGAKIVTEWINSLGLKNGADYIRRVQVAAEPVKPVRGLEK